MLQSVLLAEKDPLGAGVFDLFGTKSVMIVSFTATNQWLIAVRID